MYRILYCTYYGTTPLSGVAVDSQGQEVYFSAQNTDTVVNSFDQEQDGEVTHQEQIFAIHDCSKEQIEAFREAQVQSARQTGAPLNHGENWKSAPAQSSVVNFPAMYGRMIREVESNQFENFYSSCELD